MEKKIEILLPHTNTRAELDILKVLDITVSDIEKNSETDVEHKIIVPLLETVLGYTQENNVEKKFRVAKNIPVGSRLERISPDIAVYVNKEPFLLIDSKPVNRTIVAMDVNEAISNGRLYEFPKQFPYSIVSTGLKWEVYNTTSGAYLGDVDAIPDIYRAKKMFERGFPLVTDVKKLEAHRLIETRRLIHDRQAIQSLFKECKVRIEAEGKYGIEALSEISKILLAKIFEEQYSVEDKRKYRFSSDFIEEQTKAYPKRNATDIINDIFLEANEKYRGNKPSGIFPKNTRITLSYGTVKRIVKLLEPYAFYGGGEDIKGAVYETFLKALFRGEFGQYFTPREVVQFVVQLVDPKPGERIIDPACGSGGFLIHSFIEVRKKILTMKISDTEKEERIERLLNKDIWGVDVADTLVQFCKINLIIQGDGYQNIYRSNALDKNKEPLRSEKEMFDVVLTNPPFDLPSEHLEHIVNDYELEKKLGLHNADQLYLERCYELLKPGGRLAIVVPHRFIDAKNLAKFRQWILEKMVPRGIISLPVGVFKPFGGSNARTSILYLRKPRIIEKEKKGHTLMATVKHVGFETGISEYKPLAQNDFDNLLVSPQLIQMKREEEDVHGIH